MPKQATSERRTLLRMAPACIWATLGALQGGASVAQPAPPAGAEAVAAPPTGADAAATLPSELQSSASALRSVGTARMRFWGLHIYDARLWAGAEFKASAYARSPFALELIYARSLDGKAIAERSLQEMRRQGPLTAEQEQTWLAAMERAFPDVKAGDRIVGAHSPGSGARFWHNGQPRAGMRDAEFSRRFFGIWLSEATSEPRLRLQLLGLAAP